MFKKMEKWYAKKLSKAGKEVLIKVIAQAIPCYAMQCFKLPSTMGQEMENMMAKFFWGSSNSKNATHWVNWDKLTMSKQEGGLGFRNLEKFNLALLAKQAWRIAGDHESLLARIYKSKYFPDSNFWDASLGSSPSFTWRGIILARGNIRQFCKWRVGNGATVRIWLDALVAGEGVKKLISPPPVGFENARVNILVDMHSNQWDADLIRELFPPYEAQLILEMPVPNMECEDQPIWPHGGGRNFDVKSAYKVLIKKHFVWRLLWRALPTSGNMVRRGMEINDFCKLSGQEGETEIHLFKSCPFSVEVYRLLEVPPFPQDFTDCIDMVDWALSELQQAHFLQ
ncbi:hypothetical protein LIER_17291 [Lithospermum erythrorhizon]|uniref:Reverse transcriptase zinc-binding domain-containing protein n=1 Tax=Lithospermum erythrorhizon TaxID=34254 RepID=A0AAV3QCB3_LITER